MFKYKSPLSRLLEGAGKTKDEDKAEPEIAEAEQPERPAPIADFNALRQALGGGDTTAETYEEDAYEETDDLIPEDRMPEFDEAEEVEETIEEVQDDIVADEAEGDDDQIVTLHLNQDAAEDEDENLFAAVAKATADPVEETPAEEPVITEAPAPAAEAPAPVAEEVTPEPAPEPTPEPEVAAEVEAAAPQEPAATPEPAPAPVEDRRSRVKTTFLGFERADTHVQEMMETAAPVAKTEAAQQTYPVGWLVVTGGPGRGASITVTEGLMQIGRNDDQAIQLDFGDTGISRSNHAVIAYDPEDRKCYLGHGGKANLVRLNGKPVLSTIALSTGDAIRISETTIRFTAFCDDGFDWRDAD
ncbi:FHA domain-containing protein [Ruegeria sp.]|uniref:FHA domain-containing protein n=1 Tax=Ruegeria sp. TaxID=1879320 RepID=UPI00231F97B4|nr:FHA domain-containing protein [Ruegeria sp.]MDA7965149.1 FHA domain-containing protein [Ruegeria sp.]